MSISSFPNDLWQRAAGLAHATPDERNRYVDFLRAASIAVVILGHWLAAAPYFDSAGELVPGNMLEIASWTQWLTLERPRRSQLVHAGPDFVLVHGDVDVGPAPERLGTGQLVVVALFAKPALPRHDEQRLAQLR